MAPTRPSTKKKNKSKKHSKPSSSSTTSTPPISDPATILALLTSATALLEQGDASSAHELARSALSAIESAPPSPSSLPLGAALTLLGSIAVETGDIASARSHFLRAVDADPDGSQPDALGGGAEKFLWLAQLSDEGGRDSVRWFERGAGALRGAIARAEEEEQKRKNGKGKKDDEAAAAADDDGVLEEKRRKLAETLCAVAEVYMTDLSWEADAEARCEALIAEAGLVAPADHAETWQTVANVRISQERVDEARAALDRSMAVWRDLEPEDPRVPAFASRVGLARLLIEVGMEAAAVEVVERLVGEDDESVEAWYLGGFALYNAGVKARDEKKEEEAEWKSAWRSARGWLAQCLLLFQRTEYEDERLGEHANELLTTIRQEVGDGSAEEDDEWEDEDGNEDEEDGDEDEEMQ